MIFITACSKDKKEFKKENTTSTIATTLRSGTSLDTTWLINFEDYLSDLRDNISTAATYTNDETEYGIETLVNLKYSRYKADFTTTFDIDTFNYIAGNEDPYDLFLKCKSTIIEDTTGTKIVAYNLELDTIINGTSQYVATTIFSSGLVGNYNEPPDSLYFGAGELYPHDEPSDWLECAQHGYSCGNDIMETTVLTEIQKLFNASVPDNYCEDYNPETEASLVTFYDIHDILFKPSWYALWYYYSTWSSYDLVPKGGYISCACLDSLEFSSLYVPLRDKFLPEAIPVRYEFMAMDFATDFQAETGPPQGDVYDIRSKVIVGRVMCRYSINAKTEVAILDPDIIP